MPAKRKAAAKAAPVESTRPSRSASGPAKAGSKRKGSASPAPPAKKGVGVKKAASESEATGASRISARGRSATKQAEEPKPREASKTSRATRAAVEEVETKKAASRGRSKTPSTPKQTKATPKATTPKAKTPTPSPRQTKSTPKQKASTPRQRSATPKSKPATPKQKAVTPKSARGTPKQKTTPKQTPKAKQKNTQQKSVEKKSSQKKEESPKKVASSSRSRKEKTEEAVPTKPVSVKKSSPRKVAEKSVTAPSKQSSRSPRRSRGKDEDETEKKEQIETETEEEVSKAADIETEQTNDDTADKEQESKDLGEEEEKKEEEEKEEAIIEEEKEEAITEEEKEEAITEEVKEEENKDEDEQEEDSKEEIEKEAVEDDKTEAMDTDEVAKEDENVEQDQVVEESKPAQSEVAETNEIEESEAMEEQNVEAENTAPIAEENPEPVSAEKELEESAEKDVEEDVTESQAESEQVESEDKECESAESEQVEADTLVEQSNQAEEAEPIVINEDSGDSAEAEIISDVSEKSEQEVIELNEDSGDAVILVDPKEDASADQAEEKSESPEEIQAVEEPVPVKIDDGAGIEMAEEAIENDAPSTSIENGLIKQDENDSAAKKRKIDDVEDVEDSGEFSKKSKITVDGNNLENGTVSQVEDDDDFVVIEMSDVPPTDSSEVKESIPKDIVTQNVDNDLNPIFNREYVPNPAFSGTGDNLKQFSLVSYNILADCHLFRNDYSFTDKKYLMPEYRLEKIIEELKYLDGDIICLQEVDPSFFSEKLLPSLQSIGYEGFHKKRTQEYFNEGEATFYKTGRFTVVEAQVHRIADLVEKVLVEGSVDGSVQEAVRKYMDLPDVLVVTKLRCNNTGAELTVGNVHINWGEMKTPDAQCVQIASAIKEAVQKAGSDNVPHIICGDFNSPPLSPGYLVARDGYPSGDETINKLQQIMGMQLPEGKTDSLVNCLWPAFQHTSSSLKSAYQDTQSEEPSISSYNKVMCDCVDYIFYSSTSIDSVGVYRVPSKEKIMETGGTPNLYFPSDHVSMKAVLSFK